MEIKSIVPTAARSSEMARILVVRPSRCFALDITSLEYEGGARERRALPVARPYFYSRETGRAGTGFYSSALIFPSFTVPRARVRARAIDDVPPLRARFRTAEHR